MKKVELRFLKFYNLIILGLLTILGFTSSCEKNDPDLMSEYGTPSAKFIVNGTIESIDSNTPIENIQVIMQGNTAITDSKGKYQVAEVGSPRDQSYIIQLQDIDGVSNGDYENLDTIVQFMDPQFINGDNNWYEGETSKELNIKLNPKK